MTRYAIGLGSNLGDRLGHLSEACAAIEESLGGPIVVSSLYETEPVGGPEQGPFLNAVVIAETDKRPEAVLDLLQAIEKAHGRERTVHWGPRSLDLDIIAADTAPVTSPDLIVPHPRAAEREFVLRPLVEVWPEAPLGHGATAASALSAIGDQGVERLGSGWLPPVSKTTANTLLAAQFVLIALVGLGVVVDGTWPRELTAWAVAGAGIAVVGLVLAVWASRSLGSAMTASPLPKLGSTLVTKGPYRYARHPIYGGLLLFLGGCGLLAGSLLALAATVLLVPLFLVKSHYEEGRLRMQHADYRSYREQVPHRLIPFIL